MGEYADDYFRREVQDKFGFDPGPNDKPQRRAKPSVPKAQCTICKRSVKAAGLADHMRDAHGVSKSAAKEA